MTKELYQYHIGIMDKYFKFYDANLIFFKCTIGCLNYDV